SGRGGHLDTVAVAALVVEDGGKVDRGRVTADADGVDRARGRCDSNNHEAQRKRRKAPDQTQCQYSAMSFVPAKATAPAHAIDARKAKGIKGFPPADHQRELNGQHNFANMLAGLHAAV